MLRQKIEKPNNLSLWEQENKGPNQEKLFYVYLK